MLDVMKRLENLASTEQDEAKASKSWQPKQQRQSKAAKLAGIAIAISLVLGGLLYYFSAQKRQSSVHSTSTAPPESQYQYLLRRMPRNADALSSSIDELCKIGQSELGVKLIKSWLNKYGRPTDTNYLDQANMLKREALIECIELNQYEIANKTNQRAIQICQSAKVDDAPIPWRRIKSAVFATQSEITYYQNKNAESISYAKRALAPFLEITDELEYPDIPFILNAASKLSRAGELEESLRALNLVFPRLYKVGSHDDAASILLFTGDLNVCLGHHDEALAAYKHAYGEIENLAKLRTMNGAHSTFERNLVPGQIDTGGYIAAKTEPLGPMFIYLAERISYFDKTLGRNAFDKGLERCKAELSTGEIILQHQWLDIAKIALHQGANNEELYCLSKAVESQDYKLPIDTLTLLKARQAYALIDSKRCAEAISSYEKLRRTYLEDPTNKKNLLIRMDLEMAIHCYQQGCGNAKSYVDRALACMKQVQKKTIQAANYVYLSQALKLAKNADASRYFQLAKESEDSPAALKQMSDIDLQTFSQALISVGDLEVTRLAEAIRTPIYRPAVYIGLGDALVARGDKKRAHEAYEKALVSARPMERVWPIYEQLQCHLALNSLGARASSPHRRITHPITKSAFHSIGT